MRFGISRTSISQNSSFFETILLIHGLPKVFSVKTVEIDKNQILALSLALIVALPVVATSINLVGADANTAADDQTQTAPMAPLKEGVWYKFSTSLITLLFPVKGEKPMFIWWYTNDSSQVYVVKFNGLVEYLTFDTEYYIRRYPANGSAICERLVENYIGPKMGHMQGPLRQKITNKIEHMKQSIEDEFSLHPAYLPFSSAEWRLDPPTLVPDDNVSYWSFNFTLIHVPMPKFAFAQNNVQIRCRFYNTNATETIDENHSYSVAAEQLKFDFVVRNWEWNIDKIEPFLEELKDVYDVTVPAHKAGLALWINLASIKIDDLTYAEEDVQNKTEVETRSQMQGSTIGDEYYSVKQNSTASVSENERPIQLTNKFKERVRICFANKGGAVAGFLEYVPWARLLNETGGTVGYVNVTASYIAAGGHMRLFLCYPYFGNYTLEHDPTIGLSESPLIPSLTNQNLLMILVGATIAIAVAVAGVKLRRKPVNIVNVH